MSDYTASDCLQEMWKKLSSALSANPAVTKALAGGLFQRKVILNATRQDILDSVFGGRHIADTLMNAVRAYVRTNDECGKKGITALIEELREQGLDDLSTELSKKYSWVEMYSLL